MRPSTATLTGSLPSGVHRWSRRFGTSGDDRGTGLVATADAVVLTGYFDDRMDFGGGPILGEGAAFVP